MSTDMASDEESMNRRLHLSATTIAMLEIVTVCLVLAGVFMLLTGGTSAYEAYSSQFWPTTTGEIVTSRVDTYADAYGKRTYRNTIKYMYTVSELENSEEPFTGERVSIDPFPPSDSRTIAESRLAPYPKGEMVVVYYNPNRPQRSMLEPSFSVSRLISPAVGLLAIVVGFSLRFLLRRDSR